LHSVTPAIISTGRIGIWVYVTDYTLLSGFVTKVSHGDTSFTNGAFQSYNMADADKAYNGWHFIGLDLAEWAGAYGTPNWATTVNTIRLSINQNSAVATTVYIDSIVHSWNAKGKIIITNDDGWASWFTLGIPVLNGLGLKSTASIIADQVDLNASWVTTAQLQSTESAGHDLCVHGGTALSALADLQARINSVKSNKDYLTSRAHTKADDIYVWPNGVYQLSAGDQELINILKAQGFVCARGTTNVRYYRHSVGHADNRWLIPIIGVDAATSPATILSYFNVAATRGATAIIMYHEILNSGAAGGTQRNLADFTTEMTSLKALVDSNLVDVVTFSDWAENTGLISTAGVTTGITGGGITTGSITGN